MGVLHRETLLPTTSELVNTRRRNTPSTPPSPIKLNDNGYTRTRGPFDVLRATSSSPTGEPHQSASGSTPSKSKATKNTSGQHSRATTATLIAIIVAVFFAMYILYSRFNFSRDKSVTFGFSIINSSRNSIHGLTTATGEDEELFADAHVRRMREIDGMHKEHQMRLKQQATRFDRRVVNNMIVDDNLPADQKWAQGMFNEHLESTRTCPNVHIDPYLVDSLQRHYKEWRTPAIENYEREADMLKEAETKLFKWRNVYPEMSSKCRSQIMFSNVQQNSDSYLITCSHGEYAIYRETDSVQNRTSYREIPRGGKVVYKPESDEVFMALCAEKLDAKNLYTRVAFNATLQKQQNAIHDSHGKVVTHGILQTISAEDRISVLVLRFNSLSRQNFLRSMRFTKGVIEKLEYDPSSKYRVLQYWRYQISNSKFKFADLESVARKLGLVTFEASNYCNKNGGAHHQLNRLACMRQETSDRNCLFGRNIEEYMFDYAEDMLLKYRSNAKFGMLNFNMLNSLHPADLDYLIGKFLERITRNYPNLAILIMSDSGEDTGPFYATPLGQLEHRQPVFVPILSNKLTNYAYAPRIFENMAYNQDKLFTSCDIFMTLAHFFQFPNKEAPEFVRPMIRDLKKKSFGDVDKCYHLQSQIPEQSCSQYPNDITVQVDCICPPKLTKSSLTEEESKDLANAAIVEINNKVDDHRSVYPFILSVRNLQKVLFYNNIVQFQRVGVAARPEFAKIIFSARMSNGDWQVFEVVFTRAGPTSDWTLSDHVRRVSMENGQSCDASTSLFVCSKY